MALINLSGPFQFAHFAHRTIRSALWALVSFQSAVARQAAMAAREAAEASGSFGCPYERFAELLRRSREVKSTATYDEAQELLGSSPSWQEVPDECMRRFGFDIFVNKLREAEDKRSERRRAERLAVERAASARASWEEECAACERRKKKQAVTFDLLCAFLKQKHFLLCSVIALLNLSICVRDKKAARR